MKFSLLFFLSVTTLLFLISSATAVKKNSSAKVAGGADTDIRDVPYQVSVRLSGQEKKKYGSGHICGGMVLSQRMVGTAAHCFFGKSNRYRTAAEFILVMGSSFLNSGAGPTLHFYVQQVTMHPNFNTKTLQNDIGIFFINGFIPWDSFVTAIPIAGEQMKTNTECLVSGWGALKTAGPNQNLLQSAHIYIIDQSDCSSAYGNVPSSQICAGLFETGGVDSCQGDSGGPLQCKNLLVGIVSYGRECAEKKYPGVYTNVVQYDNWIARVNDSFDYSVYRSAAVQLTVHHHTLWLTNLCILFIAASY